MSKSTQELKKLEITYWGNDKKATREDKLRAKNHQLGYSRVPYPGKRHISGISRRPSRNCQQQEQQVCDTGPKQLTEIAIQRIR